MSQPEQPAAGSALDWAVRYAVPLMAGVGVLLYGMLRLAYVFFYLQLRATPQDLGYGYVEILSSQLVGTIELVLVLTAVLVAVALTGRGLRRTAMILTGRARPAPAHRPWTRLVLQAGGAAVVIVLTFLPAAAWLWGTEARHGYTVRSVYLARTVRVPVLAVQALPAVVAWSTDTPSTLQDLMTRRCLLYLGQAAGTTVFYDVKSRESLRVPSAQIIVAIQNTDGVPLDC
ncbi:hypothetical protein QLQ12_44205 [Actinoplanes sp. NEAU-A12]|uniref:Uncharacterized protein n=1 Tax=Actinoplanes sandaracinus TaxID=3045177 RepID=A0ABT6X183_9ACTN|nr:hypothetical protein [Actinoplanes sandaracinus]MDI6105606.1 hypothetical protein [Actinoplanes sandaracinus]